MDLRTCDVHRGQQPDVLRLLTRREKDVLRAMAEGHTNCSIARRLFVSVKTVESDVARIFDKLGIIQDEESNRRVLAVIRWIRTNHQDGAPG